jgi:putative membrane protein insertion efficiency factor
LLDVNFHFRIGWKWEILFIEQTGIDRKWCRIAGAGYWRGMPWISRRRYDRPHDPYYYDRRRPSSSCVRDACLLETGCCLAEGLDGNCLMLVLPLLPRLATAFTTGAFTTGAFTTAALGGAGRRQGRAARSLVATIRIYQRDISAHRPAVCRFTPSCSEYAAQAVQQRGAVRGAAPAARRLLRCRPGGARGLDPVRPAQPGRTGSPANPRQRHAENLSSKS